MSEFRHGRLEHLSKQLKLKDEVSDPILDFEKAYLKWYKHVIIMRWTWNKDSDEPYVILQPISVINDLNIMAQIVVRELNSFELRKDEQIDVSFIGSMELHFTRIDESDEPETKDIITCEFIGLNTYEKYHEGWKFDVK